MYSTMSGSLLSINLRAGAGPVSAVEGGNCGLYADFFCRGKHRHSAIKSASTGTQASLLSSMAAATAVHHGH